MKFVNHFFSAFAKSMLLHGLFAGLAFLLVFTVKGRKTVDIVDVSVFENPTSTQTKLEISKPPIIPKEKFKKVFGISRNTIADTSPGKTDSAVEVKAGNTLATAPDDQILDPNDPASLPIPADEYLVSKMPGVKSRVKIAYPAEAKAKKVSGVVLMKLLIDSEGAVRSAKLLRGPGFGLDEAALAAIRQFRFTPAEVNGKSVAVETQFTYEFVLEE